MDELIQRLEIKIKELIDRQDRLKYSYHELHRGKNILAEEKRDLLEKQKKAISQIQTLVSRLKTIEELP